MKHIPPTWMHHMETPPYEDFPNVGYYEDYNPQAIGEQSIKSSNGFHFNTPVCGRTSVKRGKMMRNPPPFQPMITKCQITKYTNNRWWQIFFLKKKELKTGFQDVCEQLYGTRNE